MHILEQDEVAEAELVEAVFFDVGRIAGLDVPVPRKGAAARALADDLGRDPLDHGHFEPAARGARAHLLEELGRQVVGEDVLEAVDLQAQAEGLDLEPVADGQLLGRLLGELEKGVGAKNAHDDAFFALGRPADDADLVADRGVGQPGVARGRGLGRDAHGSPVAGPAENAVAEPEVVIDAARAGGQFGLSVPGHDVAPGLGRRDLALDGDDQEAVTVRRDRSWRRLSGRRRHRGQDE